MIPWQDALFISVTVFLIAMLERLIVFLIKKYNQERDK
jgi:hypothetical protein